MAVADAALGARVVLVELMFVGPAICALGASPRETALVSTLAFVLAIPLGAASDSFASAEHVASVAALAVVGALAVAIARLRDRSEQDKARLSVQLRVARVLGDAESLEASAAELLEAIGGPLAWDTGLLWETEAGEALDLVASWTRPGIDAGAFIAASRQIEFRRGRGLPGQVWDSGRAAFVQDAIAAGNFPRGESAERSGLRGGVAFPVLSGGECVGVIELFSSAEREPDARLLELLSSVGALIGDFAAGLRASGAVRASEARKAAMLESALDGVITMDHRGHVLEFNPAAERMFGHAASEAVGRRAGGADRARVPARAPPARSATDGRDGRVDPARPARGAHRHAHRRQRVPGGARDQPHRRQRSAGVHRHVRDITDRRRADSEREELLRLEQLARLDATEARDQLEAILSGVADAVTAQAPDGRLLFANEAAVELLGFGSSEELLSAPLRGDTRALRRARRGRAPVPRRPASGADGACRG